MKVFAVKILFMEYSPGLRGVIAGETSISTVGAEGESLSYRGVDAVGLTETNNYQDTASLIIEDNLDSKEFVKHFNYHYTRICENEFYFNLFKSLCDELHPMDVIRTMISSSGELNEASHIEQTSRMISLSSFAIAQFVDRCSENIRGGAQNENYLVASALLPGEENVEFLEALDDVLILYAEHGFNASTFACRVSASTRSDLTSSITSGIGTLKGELHGGANEEGTKLIVSFNSPEEAISGIKNKLSKKEKIMGFGHGVYKIKDPRSQIVKSWVEKLSVRDKEINNFEIAKAIDKTMKEEKDLFPNVDFYGGLLLHLLGFKTELFTPIFVVGRTAGWSAHYFEQREQDTLIRPAAKYIGK